MDTELLRIAALHGGVILRSAAVERGYSMAAIDRRVDGGLLVPIFPGAGAYCLASTPVERRHRIIAATLLTPGAAADANDAAVLLGLLPPARSQRELWLDRTEPVRIVLSHETRVRTQGIHVRRQLHRTDSDIVHRFGIDIVSPPRLVLDMAGRWPIPRVEDILDAALGSRAMSIDEVIRRHLQLGRRGRRGVGVVDVLLDARVDGQHRSANALERKILGVIAAAGFPEPIRQYKVVLPNGEVRYIDLAYPELWVGVETDGYRWHAARTPWAADQMRNNELVALGWRLFRATAEVERDPADFLRQLGTALCIAA